MRKPDFVIIGAAKAATTWIQVQLQANPAIYMPDAEPHFFSNEFEKGADHYLRWFSKSPNAASVVGEKSADYLADPDVPGRMAEMLPDARLVVQLRDPVERAYSDYKMFYRRGQVSERPEEYLSDPAGPQPRFLIDGLYGQHLSRWFDHFPREQLLVLPYEEVTVDPIAMIEQVCDHIGAPIRIDHELAGKFENSSREMLLPLLIRRVMSPFKDTIRPLRGKTWFEQARSLLAKEVHYPALDDSLRRRMADFYREDIELTERLTGLDLSAWRNPARTIAA